MSMTISPIGHVTTAQFDKLDEYVHDGFGKVFEQIDNLETNMIERFEGVDKRFDAVDKRFDVLERRFDVLERRFDGLEGRFDGLEGRFDGVEGRVGGLDARLANVEFELKGISKQLTFLVGKAKGEPKGNKSR